MDLFLDLLAAGIMGIMLAIFALVAVIALIYSFPYSLLLLIMPAGLWAVSRLDR